ncbi:hypothetical protein HO133_009928 [Letharia lupina]|uniref:Uncharacterized protein n=1 Tax=Letharia lupina TaxID=560253 RepID=A0A8H6FDV1_9LECA|nr:uncharacterized protein HO133_009928 [Letharia lupina]KAF6224735.1 hypothetical protein HO133_009928 [Letharia lupina]
MQSQSLAMAKPHLLSLPTEIIQSIYLHCLSPHLPLASPILATALSTQHIYKLTFLHAFWNRTPLVYAGAQVQQAYEPGPHVQDLFCPLPVPSGETDDAHARTERQEAVLGYRWCTFHRAKRYLSEAMSAVMKDLLLTLHLPLLPSDQTRLDAFIAQLPTRRCTFSATALDGSTIALEYPRRLATALRMTYDGHDPRFDTRATPNLTVSPTHVLCLPSHILTGHPTWTDSRIDFVQMVCSHVNLRTVQHDPSALSEGMRNAIVQGNHEALLVLIWHASRFAEYQETASHDDRPFEPPAELFRLVAKRGGPEVATLDQCPGSEAVNNATVSVRLFALLLRAHAESMPRDDPGITAWAHRLLTCQGSSKNDRAFAQWVLDWGSDGRSDEYINERYTLRRLEVEKVRRPMFRGGCVSRKRKGDEMAERFVEMCGGRIESFGDEVEAVEGAKGG